MKRSTTRPDRQNIKSNTETELLVMRDELKEAMLSIDRQIASSQPKGWNGYAVTGDWEIRAQDAKRHLESDYAFVCNEIRRRNRLEECRRKESADRRIERRFVMVARTRLSDDLFRIIMDEAKESGTLIPPIAVGTSFKVGVA